jgi:hypothetical protein
MCSQIKENQGRDGEQEGNDKAMQSCNSHLPQSQWDPAPMADEPSCNQLQRWYRFGRLIDDLLMKFEIFSF